MSENPYQAPENASSQPAPRLAVARVFDAMLLTGAVGSFLLFVGQVVFVYVSGDALSHEVHSAVMRPVGCAAFISIAMTMIGWLGKRIAVFVARRR